MERYATHYGQVTGGKVTKASTGTPQMEIGLLVLHRAEDGKWLPMPPNFNATMYIAMTDAAWEHAAAKLKTLGFNNDFRNPKFSDQVMGEGLELYSYEEEYKGKKNRRWELVRWGDRKDNEPAGEDVLLSLSAKWSAGNAAPAIPAGRPAAPTQRSTPVVSRPTPSRAAPPAAAQAASEAATSEASTATAEWDRDGAWQHYVTTCEERSIDPGVDKWGGIISTVAKECGKAEMSFNAEQWARVAEIIDIPF